MCGEEAADLNFLQTALNAAVEREDYEEAAALRDRVAAATSVQVGCGADWRAESVPEWLADRLARLNFRAPTLVQTNALRAILSGDDAAVVAATGSGKTLGYLVPLLSRLSEDLLEEDLSGYLADFLAGRRAAVRRSRLQGGRDESDLSLPTPAVLIVVPTRGLGVQVSLLAYRLLGERLNRRCSRAPRNSVGAQFIGAPFFRAILDALPVSRRYAHPSRYQPGGKANMFNTGPRNLRVAGLWDEPGLYAAA